MVADMIPPFSDKTRTVCVCDRVDTRVWLGTSHTRTSQQQAGGEPSPTEGPDEPSQKWPSPARDTPQTDEFGSLEPEPSRTREPDSYVYGHLYICVPAALRAGKERDPRNQ